MKTFCLFLLLSMLLALFSVSTLAQSSAGAKTTVEKFYKLYRTRNGIVSTHELNILKPWFTVELTKLFQREIVREAEFTKKHHDEKPHFGDGFPFAPYEECMSGDKMILNQLNVSEAEIMNDRAMLNVEFLQPKECGGESIDTYKIELTKSKNRWLINDWIYSDETKLTDDLKRKDY